MVGLKGGVFCFRFDVARALAPVSPRGSAPRLELFRLCRVPLVFTLVGLRLPLLAGGAKVYVSVRCCEADIAEGVCGRTRGV